MASDMRKVVKTIRRYTYNGVLIDECANATCPSCNNLLNELTHRCYYCWMCGQALDWEGDYQVKSEELTTRIIQTAYEHDPKYVNSFEGDEL